MSKDKNYNQIMTKDSMTADEAISIIDDMYQDRCKIMEQKTETGVKIDLGKVDDIQFTNLEFASVRAIREIQSLNWKMKKKDKQIDLMTKFIYEIFKEYPGTVAKKFKYKLCISNDCDDINREVDCDYCIKLYFENKAKEKE